MRLWRRSSISLDNAAESELPYLRQPEGIFPSDTIVSSTLLCQIEDNGDLLLTQNQARYRGIQRTQWLLRNLAGERRRLELDYNQDLIAVVELR